MAGYDLAGSPILSLSLLLTIAQSSLTWHHSPTGSVADSELVMQKLDFL